MPGYRRLRRGTTMQLRPLVRIARENGDVHAADQRAVGDAEAEHARVEVGHSRHVDDIDPHVRERHLRSFVHGCPFVPLRACRRRSIAAGALH